MSLLEILILIPKIQIVVADWNIFCSFKSFFITDNKTNTCHSLNVFVWSWSNKINANVFHVHWNAGISRNSIKNCYHSIFFCHLTDFLDWIQKTCCCFVINTCKMCIFFCCKNFFKFFKIKRFISWAFKNIVVQFMNASNFCDAVTVRTVVNY